ncbi:hypothetical protein [Solwaraspora sp. WMMD937]|uniref:hypothetical protein n=1 Tax=Solwaraspora sp. WMMD937 TaxID=3016090 RepID=UPI0032B5AA7A
MSTFDELIAEASAVPVAGWDFSWFAGRATEQRPSWGYARLLGRQMAGVRRAVDVQTGGGWRRWVCMSCAPRRPAGCRCGPVVSTWW